MTQPDSSTTPAPAPTGLLSGKVAVVTAAAGAGVGGAIVRRFLAEGATVFASDVHEGRVAKLHDETGVEAEVVDAGDGEALASYLDRVLARTSGVDALVNCAGVNAIKPVWELTDEDWQRVLDVNLTAAFRASRAVLPGMMSRGDGAIVNIASITAFSPDVNESVYSVSKAALVALTRAIAKEAAAKQVRVNAIAPNTVENPFMAKLYTPERLEVARANLPFGRCVQPTEIAAAACWLCSSEASYVTGETLVIGGAPYLRR